MRIHSLLKITNTSFFISLIILFPYSANCWQLFTTMPAVEGVVTDADTGKPIENAWITYIYEKRFLIGHPGGTSTKVLKSGGILTDENGRYYIPIFKSKHILSYSIGINIAVIHPLYDSLMIGYVYIYDREIKKYVVRKGQLLTTA
ncbi:MAG: hypothetical protein ABII27_05965 [bacterium]